MSVSRWIEKIKRVEDWLVFDSRGLRVAVAPDCRGPVALIHTRCWRWWIHPETFDITVERSKKGKNQGSASWVHESMSIYTVYIFHRLLLQCYRYCSFFQVRTWGAPGSCGPGWDEDCLSGPAPEASEEASLAEWLQSARCSSSRHTEEETGKGSVHGRLHLLFSIWFQFRTLRLDYEIILDASWFISVSNFLPFTYYTTTLIA